MNSLPPPPAPGVPRRTLLGLPLWFMALRGLAGPLAAASDASQSQHRKAIERGIDWLCTQQAADGGWHSNVYGQMRCGVGSTALVLYALAELPKSAIDRCRGQIDRGFGFIMSNLAESGFVRSPDGESDYPSYATALGLTAATRLKLRDREPQRLRMRQYLIAAQQTAERGWPATRLDLGGWNTTEPVPAGPEARDGTSVSMMRFAIEAVAASGPLPNGTRLAALGYLSRCQNLASGGDGGFFMTPRPEDPLNKAGWVEVQGAHRAVSYGTPTADGLWILARCGISPDDCRRQSASRWLQEHSQNDNVPGIADTDTAEVAMRDGLKFYYWAALAGLTEIFSAEEFHPLSKKLTALLIAAQKPDGSWQNSENAMREDDPLIATSWGLTALARLAGEASGCVESRCGWSNNGAHPGKEENHAPDESECRSPARAR